MLVLGRKISQRLVIDDRIVVTVVQISGGCVRLGIEAPAEVAIKREELVRTPAGKSSAAASSSTLG